MNNHHMISLYFNLLQCLVNLAKKKKKKNDNRERQFTKIIHLVTEIETKVQKYI